VGNLLHHRRDSLRPPSPLFKRSHLTASITTKVNKDAKVLNLPTLETHLKQNRNNSQNGHYRIPTFYSSHRSPPSRYRKHVKRSSKAHSPRTTLWL
jgi:hypothetical protein